jgi:hypothetical protein
VVGLPLRHVPTDEKNPEPDEGAGAAESGYRPRPRAPTLVGVGPESGPLVVGAVARPNRIPTPAPTDRALFDVAGDAGEAVDDAAWPEEPPPAPAEPPEVATSNPVPLATPPAVSASPTAAAPPAPPASPERPLPPPARAPRARSRLPWMGATLVVALGALTAAAWQAHAVRGWFAPSPAAGSPPVAPPPETAAPEPPAAAVASSAPTTTVLPPFDAHAAEHALGATAKAVARCRHGKVFGHGQATVTFGGDGAVTGCVVSGRFTDTPAGACVVAALSGVHAAPFAGEPQTVVHNFEVAPR